jgi:hypothetical protein
MFIQGNLQQLFDALYAIGAIDPVLKMDWAQVTEQLHQNSKKVMQAVSFINDCQGGKEQMIEKLNQMDPQAVTFLALEVAREFAEFQDRKELH